MPAMRYFVAMKSGQNNHDHRTVHQSRSKVLPHANLAFSVDRSAGTRCSPDQERIAPQRGCHGAARGDDLAVLGPSKRGTDRFAAQLALISAQRD